MVGAVGPTRIQSLGAVRAGEVRGTRAGQAMTAIAGRIAGRLADELDLDGRGRRDGDGGRGDEGWGDGSNEIDLYEVAATARSLNGDLGGRPTDEGMLARSLGDFVTESASLIVARPERASFGLIAAAIEEGSARSGSDAATETVATALSSIDRTTRRVASTMRGAAV